MKKPLISKRFITNLLIVLFGVIVLLATGAATYELWFSSADRANPKTPTQPIFIPTATYRIDSGYLCVYDASTVMSAFVLDSGAYATDPHAQIYTYNSQQYACLPVVVNNYVTGTESENKPTYKLLDFAYRMAQDAFDETAKPIINKAIYQYRQAIIHAGLNYRIVDNKLYIHGGFEDVYQGYADDGQISDKDVVISNDFPSSSLSGEEDWALVVDTNASAKYADPREGSTALNILKSGLDSATSAETSENNLLAESGAPSGLSKLWFSQDKDILQRAVNRYRAQISHTTSTDALTLSSVDTIEFNGSAKISFSVNPRALGSTPIKTLNLKINNTSVWESDPSIPRQTSQNSWDPDKKEGFYVIDSSVGTAEQRLSTAFSGPKVIDFAAINQSDQLIDQVSKTITVGGDPTSGPQTGGGAVSFTVTVPHSVNKADTEAAKEVPITLSGTNFNTAGQPKKVEKIAVYICHASREEVLASGNDSNQCHYPPMTHFGLNPNQFEFSNKIIPWDATGTPLGISSVMIKAFAPSTDNSGTFPPVLGSEKVVSDNVQVINDPSAVDGGGDTGGGSTPGETVNLPWIANFAQSSIERIDELVSRIGGFTLLILAILAVVAIIIAGMKYITSGGDPKGAETGKKALLFAIYGIVIAVLSVALAQITIKEVTTLFGNQPLAPDNNDQIIPSGIFTLEKGPNLQLGDFFNVNNTPQAGGTTGQPGLIWRIIRLAIYWAEVVAVFFILFASFQYITSYGDEGKAESAKKTLIWAIVGLAIILAAGYLLVIFTEIVV